MAEIRETAHDSTPFGSNAVRLSLPEWGAVLVLLVGLFLGVPACWEHIEHFEPGPDYRIPYALSNDYWLYARYCRWAAEQDKTLVLGDSVIWGEYVSPQDTLTHYLNERAGPDRFINMGVNGIHPVAMAGLIRYYGRGIAGQKVLLHYNPLWMSSAQHDLQVDKEFRFNHPELVPQFTTRIPCYKDPYADRIGIVVERYLALRGWASHLAAAYFDNTDIAAWAREHPYANPLGRITLRLPGPDTALRHKPVPWTESGEGLVNFQWIGVDTSLQWRFFQETVHTLLARHNAVFVVVGPFNEHMLTPESGAVYAAIKERIVAWLEQQRIPYYAPSALPSDLYADASHPLADGYARLAAQILEQEAFKEFAARPSNASFAAAPFSKNICCHRQNCVGGMPGSSHRSETGTFSTGCRRSAFTLSSDVKCLHCLSVTAPS